jgi:hypothetical protein
MLLMGLVLEGGYLVCFVHFCTTFLGRFGAGGRGKDKDGADLCGLPPLPQEHGHGKDGAPSFFCGRDDFSDILTHEIHLWRITSIVRFWELKARRVGLVYFSIQVVCFVWFICGTRIRGA